MAWQLVDTDVSDGSTSQSGSELAVVIEHDRSVSGDPSVGLYSGCPETQCQLEGRKGVFLCVSPCTTVTEQNRGVAHATTGRIMSCAPWSLIGRL